MLVRIFFSVAEERYFLVYEAVGRILRDVVPRLAKRLEIQRPLLPRFRSTPFRFKPLNLVTILCRFTYREPVTGNAIFRVYIWGIVRFLSFDNGRSSRIEERGGGDFFLPLRTFFFISLFEIFSYFFEITFFVSYENKG